METNNKKNMVILKNLPSNLVEEAIIILKSNKKAKELEKIEKKRQKEKPANIKKGKDYIVKEAEMLVSSYIEKIENNSKQKNNKKVKSNKKYVYISSIIIIIEAIMLIIK